jgi:hypothetical protein
MRLCVRVCMCVWACVYVCVCVCACVCVCVSWKRPTAPFSALVTSSMPRFSSWCHTIRCTTMFIWPPRTPFNDRDLSSHSCGIIISTLSMLSFPYFNACKICLEGRYLADKSHYYSLGPFTVTQTVRLLPLFKFAVSMVPHVLVSYIAGDVHFSTYL